MSVFFLACKAYRAGIAPVLVQLPRAEGRTSSQNPVQLTSFSWSNIHSQKRERSISAALTSLLFPREKLKVTQASKLAKGEASKKLFGRRHD